MSMGGLDWRQGGVPLVGSIGVDRKAVFLDVDGTLVDDRGLVPESAQLAVRAARSNGHLVFLCTGRSTSELWQEITDLGFDGIIAAAGGYVEFDGQVLSHRNIPVEDVRRAVTYFAEHGIDYLLESNSGIYGSSNSKSRLRELFFGFVTDEDVLAELQRGLGSFIESVVVGADPGRPDINKILFLHSETPMESIRSEFAGMFDLVPTSVPMFGANSGELAISGVHKGGAIEFLIEHLGIARENTVAFGDGLNDIEMLQFVNMGVAMGNARPEVKDVADDVTGRVDQDGIHDGFTKHGLI